jgi:hypothetical protein
MKTCPASGNAFPRENPNHWKGLTADDIPQGWMDDMVKRLFEVLNREIIKIETVQRAEPDKDGAKNPTDDPQRRSVNARTLTQLQGALARLTDMEMRRIAARETKVVADDDDALAALERRLDERLAAMRAAGIDRKIEQ